MSAELQKLAIERAKEIVLECSQLLTSLVVTEETLDHEKVIFPICSKLGEADRWLEAVIEEMEEN